MEKKIAFFDMDGTLTAPCFKVDAGGGSSQIVYGFNKEDWIKFCSERMETAYDHVWPVKYILERAKAYVRNGYEVKILTVAFSEGERVAKKHWLNNNEEYRDTFSDIIFVSNPTEKIEYIREYISSNNINPHNCVLIEDDLSTVWTCKPLGINAMHVSHLFAFQ